MALYCTGVCEILKHSWLLDASCEQFDQLAVHSGKKMEDTFKNGSSSYCQINSLKNIPDVNGGVCQDLAVAVPAAVGGSTATGRVVPADLAKDLAFANLPQIQFQVRVTLAVTRCEAEPLDPVHLNEGQVKLLGRRIKKNTVKQSWIKIEKQTWYDSTIVRSIFPCVIPDHLCWCVGAGVWGSRSGNIFVQGWGQWCHRPGEQPVTGLWGCEDKRSSYWQRL